jgi:phenylacetate-CoA ligase
MASISSNLVITEVVDGDNRPVPPGVYGDKLLVTVLFNRTQPLIRYELNDSVRLAVDPPPCSMAYRTIDGIQGRTEDLLRFPGVAGGEVIVHPNVLHRVMDLIPAGAWQIVREPNGLSVLLANGRDGIADTTLSDMLRQAITAQGAEAPAVRVRHVPAIPKGATGKTRLIVT